MSKQTEAIEILLTDSLYARILGPAFNRERETLHFDQIDYGVLSGGERAAISWAFAIWEDKQSPKLEKDWQEWPGYEMRDPFSSFGVMDFFRQKVVLRAFAHRWGVRS